MIENAKLKMQLVPLPPGVTGIIPGQKNYLAPMFTGIIECLGTIEKLEKEGTNKIFWIRSSISGELRIDQSVSHNGVCLTIDALAESRHRVTAIEETLKKSNLDLCRIGDTLNLERCMLLSDRLDGHIVQGHVDSTGVCIGKIEREGSWEFQFRIDPSFALLIIEKGSIALNGTSLTLFAVTSDTFKVAIIPYTYAHTTIKNVEPGTVVNLEFDLVGKYIQRNIQVRELNS